LDPLKRTIYDVYISSHKIATLKKVLNYNDFTLKCSKAIMMPLSNILFREVNDTWYHFTRIWAFTKIKSRKGLGRLSSDFAASFVKEAIIFFKM
jgi:hypothetical protein